MKINALWNYFNDAFASSLIHPQYFIKIVEKKTLNLVLKYCQGDFLDIGCGRQWYRKKIENHFKSYLSLDHPDSGKKYITNYPIEIKADVCKKIPLKDRSLDSAMMIMVLEHLTNPEKALQEINRILKKKGILVICTVENYPGHDLPQNYYHFTKFGLQEILKRNGFLVKNILSFGNFWQTQTIFRNVYLMQVVKHLTSKKPTFILGALALLLFSPVIILSNIFTMIFFSRYSSEEYALAHIVIAQKQ